MSKYQPQAIRGSLLVSLFAGCLLQSQAHASEKQLLWGDTHVHSAYSFDAFLNGNQSVTPDEAYRFARGEPVIHPMYRARMQLIRPLDFLAVADHAEYLGVAREMYFHGAQLEDAGIVDTIKAFFTERYIRNLIDGDGGFDAFIELLPVQGNPREAAKGQWADQPSDLVNSAALESKTWRSIVNAAEQFNEPGVFTTFVAWEWSSLPGGANLHRVVISDADGDTGMRFEPFGSDVSPYPEDLWRWLDKTKAETGVDFIAIPHNSNISKGYMFAETSLRGDAIGPEYARLRARLEPVAEITQIKGDSETHPLFSVDDEFADFETYGYYIQQTPESYKPQPADYIRPALKTGLSLEQDIGVNPYRFGLIGSTDAHTGLATADERGFGGKMARDSTPETKSREQTREGFSDGWNMSASGLAAVWADANDRQSIMDAFRRREVYATSGPRIRLQVFAGFELDETDLENTKQLRQRAVAMGGVLNTEAGDKQAPTLLFSALKDPLSAGLDRVQIVKLWIDEQGAAQERVFDVAWHGGPERMTDAGQLQRAQNPSEFHAEALRQAGAVSLHGSWTDPSYQVGQSSAYYVRVLEVPTPRHTYLDALALGLKQAPKGGCVKTRFT